MILVTGGAGFIGSHLVRLLVERGEVLRVLDLPTAPLSRLPLQHIELVLGDIRDKRTVRRAVRGCREVYHLAGNPNLWTQQRGNFRQVNYVGAVNVIDAALGCGARRVLHTSTESILTRAGQSEAIREGQHITYEDVIGPYCRSKYLAERYALRLGRAGAPVVVANPTLPIGPGDLGQSPPTQMMLDFCRGKRREYVDADLNLIDVRDVAEGMIRVMEHGRPGRRYLLGHENWSILAVFRLLARLTGLPEPRWRIPYPVALATAYASEFVADVFTHRPPAATITGVMLTRRRMHFDPSCSLAELDLHPRPVAGSIAETVVWFRKMGWIGPLPSSSNAFPFRTNTQNSLPFVAEDRNGGHATANGSRSFATSRPSLPHQVEREKSSGAQPSRSCIPKRHCFVNTGEAILHHLSPDTGD